MDAWRRGRISTLVALFLVVLAFTACSSSPGEAPTAGDNRAPTAVAGPSRTVPMGQAVELDGSASSDPDDDALTFIWTLEEVPGGSAAAVDDGGTASATFVPDVAGAYSASLIVSDGSLVASDTLSITAIVSTGTTPALSSIDSQRTTVGVAIEVPFTVSDEAPDTVSITASSSDQTLVADSDIQVSGGGAERSVLIAPAPAGFGSTVITLIAEDAEGLQGAASFTLDVREVFGTQFPLIKASDATDLDQFGASVAIDGDDAVIGARGDDDDGSRSGSAYVFRRGESGWVQSMKLPASPPVIAPAALAADDLFGASVSISGNHLIVGAPGDDVGGTDTGAAYVFRRCGRFEACSQPWTEAASLKASDAGAGDSFGITVAISGDFALVGAPDNASSAGAAYVFQRSGDTWSQTAKLTATDAAVEAYFGTSVAISGDVAIVGAQLGTVAGVESGSAYVFQRSGSAWNQVATLTAADASQGSLFGSSVAISGEQAIVGAPSSEGPGSAYTFQRSGEAWIQTSKLVADGRSGFEQFGWSVAISGEYAIVGAVVVSFDVASGAAYVFQRDDTGWLQAKRLVADGIPGDDLFGRGVAISGDVVLVGSPNQGGSGAAYLYLE